jgi:hypothetical protein
MIHCTTGELIHHYIFAHILQIPVEPKKYLNISIETLEKGYSMGHFETLDVGLYNHC